MDPLADDQWISASVGTDDQIGTGLRKEQDVSMVLLDEWHRHDLILLNLLPTKSDYLCFKNNRQ